MQCCSIIPSQRYAWYRVIVKAMSTYGIQTNHGILQLSKKDSHSGISQSVESNPLSNFGDIEILVPPSGSSTFEKLRLLHSLHESCQQRGVSNFSGFYTDGYRFDKTICLCGTRVGSATNLDLKAFNKVRFQREDTDYVLKCSADQKDGAEHIGDKYVLGEFTSHHPIVDSSDFKPVYSCYQQVLPALDLIATHDNSLSLTQHIESIDPNLLHGDHTLKYPFIVVEGLDGTGKSTLSKNLAQYINGIQMGTPPSSISGIRGHFDNFPQLYRRSFYALGNYIAAQQVIQHCATQAVVMDRFWHSTTAYAIASEVGCSSSQHIPPKGHEIYNWPSDLLCPSAVVFLTTSERDRDSRVKEREEQTSEELYISASRTFRARITETYRRIGHSKWIEVDTSGTQQESLQKVVAALKLHGVIN